MCRCTIPSPPLRRSRIEAPYHALTNAGHISYIEMDGDPTKNLDAFEKVVRYMQDQRHRLWLHQPPGGPRPRLRLQRHHRRQLSRLRPPRGRVMPFERIRRITGYLVGTLDRFNNAKRAEESRASQAHHLIFLFK